MLEQRADILLVEDNPNDVKLTLHAFKTANLANTIHVARDGVEALEFLFGTGPHADRSVQETPKLILLDLKLPRLDGHEVLKRIKGDPRTAGDSGGRAHVLQRGAGRDEDLRGGRQQLHRQAGRFRAIHRIGTSGRVGPRLPREPKSPFTPSMPYRRTEAVVRRLAEREQAILDAAAAIAAEGGMAAVQIAAVAARARIAAGTVYRYFPSKTELIAELVARLAHDEVAAMAGAGDAAPGPLSALAASIATFAARALRARSSPGR